MGEIAPEEQFLLLFTIFCYLVLDFYVERRTRFSLRDKRLFEITEVDITRVNCIMEHSVDIFCIFFNTSTPVIPNYGYLKVNFLGPENLL